MNRTTLGTAPAGPIEAGRRWRRPDRLPMGLLGMLGLVAAIESGIAGADLDLLTAFQQDWAHAARALDAGDADVQIVCFGDSKMQLAVVPQVIEQRLGKSAYNLAIAGGQASSSYFLLRRMLGRGHRPEAVVVDYFPLFLKSGPWDSVPLMPHLARPADCIELGREADDPELAGALLTAWLIPSVRQRLELREMVLAHLGGRSASHRDQMAGLCRNWRVNRGAQLMPVVPDHPANPEEWRRFNFPDTDFHPIALVYVARFLRLAEQHDIPVYWLVPPTTPTVQAECERSGFAADLDAFLGRVLARYPNVVIVDSRSCGFAPDVFFDPHHLGREGAFALTHALCDALGGREAPGGDSDRRWVALPPSRDRPLDVPLEHVNDSAVIAQENLRAMQRR